MMYDQESIGFANWISGSIKYRLYVFAVKLGLHAKFREERRQVFKDIKIKAKEHRRKIRRNAIWLSNDKFWENHLKNCYELDDIAGLPHVGN